jgi:hypothetical protein
MVSAKENINTNDILDNLMRPQPILVMAPHECYQDGKTFRKTRFKCIECDFFDSCEI